MTGETAPSRGAAVRELAIGAGPGGAETPPVGAVFQRKGCPMVKHVVVAKFTAGVTDGQSAELTNSLRSLPGKIPEIKGYDFGLDVRPEKTLDFALVSTFEDMAAVRRYLVHPDHAVVGRYIRSLCESLQAIDFEYQQPVG